ncbi:Uncharacterized protein TCM_017749 [Theobroma cacao]|uniref:Uncharacterized protein n=1 Tax=Theobroma cacao TaxID=3641 RepID=A0A061EFP8_THECC|nr:Uncharacterized protein TCM_017749 [Theobroma cacao]
MRIKSTSCHGKPHRGLPPLTYLSTWFGNTALVTLNVLSDEVPLRPKIEVEPQEKMFANNVGASNEDGIGAGCGEVVLGLLAR